MPFEEQLAQILNETIPQRFLSNVPVFRPDHVIDIGGMASEIDFLFHVQRGDSHEVVIVETKGCAIEDENGNSPTSGSKEWRAVYVEDNGQIRRKDIQKQVLNQIKALRMNMEPLQEGNRVRFRGIVVTNRPAFLQINLKREHPSDPDLYLFHLSKFREILSSLMKGSDLLRVQESEILRRLRMGQAVQELGHPEIPHAIAYSSRCRAFLDGELFEHFKPTNRRWAINGSAGMGKSVLLAYSLLVLSTDRLIEFLRDKETRHLQSFEAEAAKLNLPKLEKRRILAVALSERQINSLRDVYSELVRHYQKVDPFNNFQRVSPTIKPWYSISNLDDYNILLIDESHDLNEIAQGKILQWHSSKPDRFLIVACDRHQKLRLLNRDEKILKGFEFGLHTTKLKRNYRNPFPVYAAAMALMFRWMAPNGPKVIPTKDDLENGLGFRVEGTTQTAQIKLSNRNDAHPANNWSHLVAMFTGPVEMESQLRETNLSQRDVLWVRFSREVADFGYECLSRYTYHNLYSTDSADVIDKYIKGQEFPIVVIEGLPEDFNVSDPKDDSLKSRMWHARRELYLVASRATVFLFFVRTGSESDESMSELKTLIQNLSCPDTKNPLNGPSGKVWALQFANGDPISMSDYLAGLANKDGNADFVVVPADSSDTNPIPAQTAQPNQPLPVQLSYSEIKIRVNAGETFSNAEMALHGDLIRKARAERKASNTTTSSPTPPAPQTIVAKPSQPAKKVVLPVISQNSKGKVETYNSSKSLMVVKLSRPVTPAAIAQGLSITREELEKVMLKLNITAGFSTELEDLTVGKIAKALNCSIIISGNLRRL